MVFGEGERRRTIRTSSENSTKNTEIAVFWQGSFYSCLASYKDRFRLAEEKVVFALNNISKK